MCDLVKPRVRTIALGQERWALGAARSTELETGKLEPGSRCRLEPE